MKKRPFLLALFIVILTSSFGQNKIEIGEKKQLFSKVLNEEREYWVYLPEHYTDNNFPDQNYPVIYLLDAEKHFHTATGIIKHLANEYYPQMPECIVIGIKNTNRSRDLTPTNVPEFNTHTGGYDKFVSFIEQELIPEISKKYRTLNYKILIGHSFGGLFTMSALYKSTSLFNSYVAIDPSLWWDEEWLVRQSDSVFKHKNFKHRKLFLAGANSHGMHKNPGKQLEAHSKAQKDFLNKTHAHHPKKLRFHNKFYKNEDHGSVILPSLADAFKYIFSGIRLNANEVVKNPGIIEKNYSKLSENLNFEFIPQSFYINNLADLAIKTGQEENARKLHELNIKNYPNNTFLKKQFK
ncbi:alpha/beta hydrolase [Abyssalbus ytuae]|uniref:Alpha/beta hydrolase-fold protein n=1 Tax=Abyssalbus ytuae TaxID=2926907 RepID=A0A9E7D2M9_9FLAO|nr:alpha/beta hydrolase-fold protein [Abyssalbus ytuae]UOB16854.1 alpha/beta hydrolase-fold protein [Abyssalbus ytuae]